MTFVAFNSNKHKAMRLYELATIHMDGICTVGYVESDVSHEAASMYPEQFYVMLNPTIVIKKGGPGSGFKGHAGRKGQVGGSAPSGSTTSGSSKESLEKYLKMVDSMSKQSVESIVLKHGKYYNPQPLPKGYKIQKAKQCYMNAYYLTQRNSDLTYVEGYAVPDFIDLPIVHAWAVDKDGTVFDDTWKTPGTVYFGIPFDKDFINKVLVETETYGVIKHESPTFVEKYVLGMKPRRTKQIVVTKGGSGSGFKGHAGRAGKVGGSAPLGVGGMANPEGKDTLERYMNADGTWTKERQALHTKIVDKFFFGKTPVDNPTSYVLGGGPAAGKSTLINSQYANLPKNMVLASGDDIKLLLPEYEGANSVFVHEESAYLSRKIAAKAANEGYNVIMDGTGDNNIVSLTKKVNSMRPHGQRVVGIYVTIDVDTAIKRSAERAKAIGRYVPESVLRFNHKMVAKIFPDIISTDLFDSINLYDTSGNTAKLIAREIGKDFTILDNEAYTTFLARGGD